METCAEGRFCILSQQSLTNSQNKLRFCVDHPVMMKLLLEPEDLQPGENPTASYGVQLNALPRPFWSPCIQGLEALTSKPVIVLGPQQAAAARTPARSPHLDMSCDVQHLLDLCRVHEVVLATQHDHTALGEVLRPQVQVRPVEAMGEGGTHMHVCRSDPTDAVLRVLHNAAQGQTAHEIQECSNR